MNANLYIIEYYKNKTAFRPQKNKPKQSQGIKRIMSIFQGFILAILTQAPHINITIPIVDLKRNPFQNEQKEPEKKPSFCLDNGCRYILEFLFCGRNVKLKKYLNVFCTFYRFDLIYRCFQG